MRIVEIRESQPNTYNHFFLQSCPNINNTNGTSPTPKIQNRKLRQKMKIISSSSHLHKQKHYTQTTQIQGSKVLINNNIDMVNNAMVINVDNTNVWGNNTIGTDKEHNKHQQNNNTNSHTGENQNLEENKYRSKIIRHLRKFKFRIKSDPNPKNQTTVGWTKTQHQKTRK